MSRQVFDNIAGYIVLTSLLEVVVLERMSIIQFLMLINISYQYLTKIILCNIKKNPPVYIRNIFFNIIIFYKKIKPRT